MGSGGNSIAVPINITIDATGADPASLARVRQEVATLKAELPGRIKHVVKRPREGLDLVLPPTHKTKDSPTQMPQRIQRDRLAIPAPDAIAPAETAVLIRPAVSSIEMHTSSARMRRRQCSPLNTTPGDMVGWDELTKFTQASPMPAKAPRSYR